MSVLESFIHGAIGCHHFSNPLIKAGNCNIAVGAVQLAGVLSHQHFLVWKYQAEIYIHTHTYTDIYGHIYHIYHIYHISFLRQKRLRATCETWPHKRKIFHLKSKRRPKSRQIPPAKGCCHHHSQGPPQESICAAAKGPQVTQQEPPASQKSHVTTSGGCTRGRVGSEPSPRQLCSHRAKPWHNSQTPHPWSWAGSQHPLTESPRPLLPLPTGASSTSGSPGHQGGLWRETVHQKRCKMGSMWEQGQCVLCCWHLDSHLRGPYQKDPFEGMWPYFQSLQKNSHIKLLDGSSLLHLSCFHFFINQLVKETYWGHAGLEENSSASVKLNNLISVT